MAPLVAGHISNLMPSAAEIRANVMAVTPGYWHRSSLLRYWCDMPVLLASSLSVMLFALRASCIWAAMRKESISSNVCGSSLLVGGCCCLVILVVLKLCQPRLRLALLLENQVPIPCRQIIVSGFGTALVERWA